MLDLPVWGPSPQEAVMAGDFDRLAACVESREAVLTDIADYELQMLGLWRLDRSEAQQAQDREKGAPDAT